jgi:2-methylcitrate dehydratase
VGETGSGARPAPDAVLVEIARYVLETEIASPVAAETARLALADSLACACEALVHPDCTELIGPVAPGTIVPGGVRVPGTSLVLDPVGGAFAISALIRWLDYNDTWLDIPRTISARSWRSLTTSAGNGGRAASSRIVSAMS